MTRAISLALAAALTLATAACRSSPTRFFTLAPLPPASPALFAHAPERIRIDAVRLPREYDRLELVTETGPLTVRVHDLARWSAPPAQLARRALTQDLIARLPAGFVLFPDAPDPAVRSIDVAILAFGRLGEDMVADVSWTGTARAYGGTAQTMTRTLRLRTMAYGNRPEDVAASLSAILAKLADSIAATLVAGGVS